MKLPVAKTSQARVFLSGMRVKCEPRSETLIVSRPSTRSELREPVEWSLEL
jgi:hypothetical protein